MFDEHQNKMSLYVIPRRMANTYFDLLDQFVCMYHIAPFLDYESRMNFNQTRAIQHRYTKRMNSDAHNFSVKVDLLTQKMGRVNKSVSPDQKIRAIKEVITYLLNTNDTVLLCYNTKLRETVIERATYFSDINNYPLGQIYQAKKMYELINASNRLLSKIESVKLKDQIEPKRITFV